MRESKLALEYSTFTPSLAPTAFMMSMSMPLIVVPSRNSLGAYSALVPTRRTPLSWTLWGSIAFRDASALPEGAADVVEEEEPDPPDRESEPQPAAVRPTAARAPTVTSRERRAVGRAGTGTSGGGCRASTVWTR